MGDPFSFRVRARLPFAYCRILDEALTVPDQLTNIEFVIQNARATPPVSIDGGTTPGRTCWPHDTFTVKPGGNAARAIPIRIHLEYPLYDGRLCFINDALAGRKGTIRQELAQNTIAVRQPAGGLAFTDTSLQAPVSLLSEVL
nr:hypothetical protein [Asticcacaulis tiandongensis]